MARAADIRCAFPEVGRAILSRRRIAARVAQLAGRVAADCAGRELTVLAVMSGSLIFLADLVRLLPLRLRLTFADIHSYPGCATRSQGIQAGMSLPQGLAGLDVLVVDDILDSGQTLGCLLETVRAQRPASLRTCVLLRKNRPGLARTVQPDYIGFEVDDVFVIGYGLDYNNLYRNLPDIHVMGRADGEERA